MKKTSATLIACLLCANVFSQSAPDILIVQAEQPSPTLAPLGATRLPFTKFTLLAPTADQIVDGITVEREGLSVDAVLERVTVLDDSGVQMGFGGFLNANHQVTILTPLSLKKGVPRTFIVAADRPSWSNTAQGGMTVGLSVVSFHTPLRVSGIMPVRGATHTVNESLLIGTVVCNRGQMDPGTSQTKNVGTANYTHSSVRITAGSVEPVRVKAIRWTQTGSSVPGDIMNPRIIVDGVAYDPSVSSDGKSYFTSFGNNVTIGKGFSKEISIRTDIVDGHGRTVDFDIIGRGDLYLEGEIYGFGIRPPLAASVPLDDSAQFSMAENPWYDAAQVTIIGGDITVSALELVVGQNIAVNVPYQTLGGFKTTVVGESVTARRLGFNVNLLHESAFSDVDDVTNIVLVDENGSVVAGPVDGTATDSIYTAGADDGSIVFTDAVTFPVGTHTYWIKGKLNTDISNFTGIELRTTPGTDFALVSGLTTGKSITPAPMSSILLSRVTAHSGGVIAFMEPFTDTIIAGSKQAVIGKYVLGTTNSGEDLRITVLPNELYTTGMIAFDITNVRLYDGEAAVTTGSNVLNPKPEILQTFTLDGTGLIVPKGTNKILTVRADISSQVRGSFRWKLSNSLRVYLSVTGLASAQPAIVNINETPGSTITVVPSGEFVVETDAMTPPASTVKPGDTGVTALIIKLAVSLEQQKFERFGLRFTGSNVRALKNSQYNLFVGNVKVGEGVFVAGLTSRATIFDTTLLPFEYPSLRVVVDVSDEANNGDTIAFEVITEDTYTTGLTSGMRIRPSGKAKGNTVTVQKTKGGSGGGGGVVIQPPSEPRPPSVLPGTELNIIQPKDGVYYRQFDTPDGKFWGCFALLTKPLPKSVAVWWDSQWSGQYPVPMVLMNEEGTHIGFPLSRDLNHLTDEGLKRIGKVQIFQLPEDS